ncbi:hypothetical protein TRV_07392 [Trichophyton verrucosum HKI 0517]|uniref:Uncharacterized protein n=1 Tax=Trichophyton verrucosum (strain HKI 0517) TaxID=663202 RepID=D4DJM4_TRIVH|nr:uncharacterized protein TRV_07392 [Trichophyton verrucosum HKI 0517]EFE37946.1 hypothetical protein TRV_07392 [Trichophyton verrucosum HKI 0517]
MELSWAMLCHPTLWRILFFFPPGLLSDGGSARQTAGDEEVEEEKKRPFGQESLQKRSSSYRGCCPKHLYLYTERPPRPAGEALFKIISPSSELLKGHFQLINEWLSPPAIALASWPYFPPSSSSHPFSFLFFSSSFSSSSSSCFFFFFLSPKSFFFPKNLDATQTT